MSPTARYEEGFDPLSAAASGVAPGWQQELDDANLTEELESLERSAQHALGHRLAALVRLLLQRCYQLERQTRAHSWRSMTLAQCWRVRSTLRTTRVYAPASNATYRCPSLCAGADEHQNSPA